MLSTTSLWALARVHPEDKQLRREATERLIERLKDQDRFVRVAAARALAALPPAPEITAPIWEKAFQDADETTVRYALDALAALGPPAVPRLIDALKHEKIRGQVVYILGQIGPAAAPATPALAKLIADKDERVAHEAVLALANIGPGAKDAVPALIQALQQGENPNCPRHCLCLGKDRPGRRRGRAGAVRFAQESRPASWRWRALGRWSTSARLGGGCGQDAARVDGRADGPRCRWPARAPRKRWAAWAPRPRRRCRPCKKATKRRGSKPFVTRPRRPWN